MPPPQQAQHKADTQCATDDIARVSPRKGFEIRNRRLRDSSGHDFRRELVHRSAHAEQLQTPPDARSI